MVSRWNTHGMDIFGYYFANNLIVLRANTTSFGWIEMESVVSAILETSLRVFIGFDISQVLCVRHSVSRVVHGYCGFVTSRVARDWTGVTAAIISFVQAVTVFAFV